MQVRSNDGQGNSRKTGAAADIGYLRILGKIDCPKNREGIDGLPGEAELISLGGGDEVEFFPVFEDQIKIDVKLA